MKYGQKVINEWSSPRHHRLTTTLAEVDSIVERQLTHMDLSACVEGNISSSSSSMGSRSEWANLRMMMPSSVHHPYLAAAQQQRPFSEMGFMLLLPKGEPNQQIGDLL
ncbi:unnamed protein product [Linum trigynum]|uniref:Uncharacterized protein n=1 Tax=Linum trigynum TaxID=586398 RepID=A0AAV2G297_9ROSI